MSCRETCRGARQVLRQVLVSVGPGFLALRSGICLPRYSVVGVGLVIDHPPLSFANRWWWSMTIGR